MYVCVVRGIEGNVYILIFRLLCIHFVDRVKRGMLTVVGEIPLYRNARGCYSL